MCSNVNDDVTDLGLSPKDKKSEFFEKKTLFFFQMEKFIHYELSVTIWHIIFCSGGNL